MQRRHSESSQVAGSRELLFSLSSSDVRLTPEAFDFCRRQPLLATLLSADSSCKPSRKPNRVRKDKRQMTQVTQRRPSPAAPLQPAKQATRKPVKHFAAAKEKEYAKGILGTSDHHTLQHTVLSPGRTVLQKNEGCSSLEDFRTTPVMPTVGDLREVPSLQRIPMGLPYQSLDQYLDVQFKLLREDFIAPLRCGIEAYLKDGKPADDSDNVTITEDVCIGAMSCSYAGIIRLIEIAIDASDDNEKRLMHGSLLCLSKDNFKTMLLATVITSDLKSGKLSVVFEEELKVCNRERYVMVETTTFFGAYKHILLALQNINMLSFKENIVKGSSAITIPGFLVHRSRFDMQCLAKAGCSIGAIDISDGQWPQPKDIELNSSQLEALKLALTKQFALIQGPPGTGKTHVGLKITKWLLKNVASQYGPILIACFTNHALDQFLEAICAFETKIVRLGSRSESILLQQYNITALRKRRKRPDVALLIKRQKAITTALREMGVLEKRFVSKAKIVAAADLLDEYNEVCKAFKQSTFRLDCSILKSARVIGMTTTGVATNQRLLEAVQPGIVIVEEAAQMLEAHCIVTLAGHCRHAILIGDHKQLQPNFATYALSDFNIHVSLFERMCESGLPHATLTEQHRMRPSISELVRHIYPYLTDAPSVHKYGHVRGVCHDLFFVQHPFHETSDGCSFKNVREAKYAIDICRYLLSQEYQPTQLVVLTTYGGQLKELQSQMSKCEGMDDVRACVVDSFQGEESDIVILSLVRGNSNGRIGFLKKENRICVALSRARVGFYLVGNMATLQMHSILWKKIQATLTKKGNIGNALPVQWQLSSTKGNAVINQGTGQRRQCLESCGHTCEHLCHQNATENEQQRKCYKQVDKYVEKCKHSHKMPCHMAPEEFRCEIYRMYAIAKMRIPAKCTERYNQEVVTKVVTKVAKLPSNVSTLNCGHIHNMPSDFDPKNVRCPVLVKKLLIKCQHTQTMSCYMDPKHALCDVQVSKLIGTCRKHTEVMACHKDPTIMHCAECKKSKCQIM